MKRNPDLAFLNKVSCVPLQQELRHQHQAFAAFFARHARYPRFKSRLGRQRRAGPPGPVRPRGLLGGSRRRSLG